VSRPSKASQANHGCGRKSVVRDARVGSLLTFVRSSRRSRCASGPSRHRNMAYRSKSAFGFKNCDDAFCNTYDLPPLTAITRQSSFSTHSQFRSATMNSIRTFVTPISRYDARSFYRPPVRVLRFSDAVGWPNAVFLWFEAIETGLSRLRNFDTNTRQPILTIV